MPRPTVEKLMRVLYRDGVVYDIDADSLIRKCANHMSALALFGVLSRLDDEAADFGDKLREQVKELRSFGPDCLLGFDDGSWDGLKTEDALALEEGSAVDDSPISVHYLKLHWCSNEAAYFAFGMVDYLSASYVQGSSRKREDHMHHLRLELDSPECLDKFIESLRGPFFVKVEESSEEIFWETPSHGV